MGRYLDIGGTRYLLEQLHDIMEKMLVGDIDLSNYVTKTELQKILDELNIDIDLSAYATKEDLENAIKGIDLSAYATTQYVNTAIANAQLDGSEVDLSGYALKTDLDAKAEKGHKHTMSEITDYEEPDLSDYATKSEIPSLDGYATEEYVDNAISNVPNGGNVDLSNYYTKEETYSKTEVDIKVIEANGSSVPILSMEEWIELNTQYDENINFQNKKIYFDTSIAFKNLLNDKTYRFYLYNEDGESMNYHNYVIYENGILKFCHSNVTKVDLDGQSATSVSFRTSYLYDKTQSNDEWSSDSIYGKWVNGWKTLSEDFFENTNVNNLCLCGNVFQLGNGISSPNFGYKDMSIDAYDIDGITLYYALLKSIIKIEDVDGNEIVFETVPTQEDYLEYVNNLSSGGGTTDLSNYYTKDEVYTKSETDALIPTVTNGTDGITPHIDETTKHWFIGETDTGVLAEGVNGVDGKDGTNGVDGTNGQDGTDGYTPVRGTDYWTEQDIQTIKDYIDTELGVIENGSY